MTLSRQLVLIVSLMFALVFAGTFLISIDSARRYMIVQLESHAQDTATALGLSLSPHLANDDIPVMESMVDAVFDRGYYREIVLESVNGDPVIDRIVEIKVDGVPRWFVSMVPLVTPRASADVMAGWKQGGQVYVMSHPGHAYDELWRSTVDTLVWSLGALALAMVLTTLVVRTLLNPLKDLVAQAGAVARREFPLIERLPRLRELARVVEAMNRMSVKVDAMLKEQADTTERLRNEVFRDPVTRLGNRRAFQRDLQQLVRRKEEHAFGTVLLVRIAGLDQMNRSHGFEGGDELLRRTASFLCHRFADRVVSIARLGGSDFAVLLPEIDRNALGPIADDVVDGLASLKVRDARSFGVSAGASCYSGSESGSALMSEADMALRHAEQAGKFAWHAFDAPIAREELVIFGARGWRLLLEGAIESERIALLFQPVMAADLKSGIHHEALGRLYGPDDTLIPAGVFMPMAARAGLAVALDRLIVGQVLDHARGHPEALLSVNLSASSVKDGEFVNWLCEELAGAPQIASRLSFEITEYAADSMPGPACELAGRLHELGAQFALDHYGVGDTTLAYLRSLEVDYVKIDGGLITGLREDKSKQIYVRSLVDLARAIDVRSIAECVETDAELRTVRELRVDGVQGYFVGRPESKDD